jgi:hypothetical protein
MDKLIRAFNALSIYNRIDPYFEEDIQFYYENDAEFSLDLKRSKSELALYGNEHVRFRQAFFNDLPPERRRHLCIEKLKSANILDWVLSLLACKESDIVNIMDIGKGRSIYKLETASNQSYVIKEKANNQQQVFKEMAKQFSMPSPHSFFMKCNEKDWELTKFLDEYEVFNEKKDALVPIYATSAAFGDLIDLGDRHFENYISSGHQLIAIDVSHLLEEDNEHWTKKYIAGGLYEACVLQYYIGDEVNFKHYVELFFEAYQTQAMNLFEIKTQLLGDFDWLSAINHKWVSPQQFVEHMHAIYIPALSEMFDRLIYKSLLRQLVANNVELEEYPELKMYYLADHSRISTFFRVEDISKDPFPLIRELAFKHLGITPQYFTDHAHSLSKVKAVLENHWQKTSLAS